MTVVGGRYVDRLERRDGRWAIAVRVCTAEWWTHAPSQLEGPALDSSILANPLAVARDRTDVSYERPLVARPADAE